MKEPEIRFKEFKGEWETSPLNQYAKKRIEKNIKKLYDVTLTNSAEYGIIDQRFYFDHDISNAENISGYYVVREYDFVYNPRISTTAPVGPINQNKLGYIGVMSPLYLVFVVNGIDRNFLEIYFHTSLWHKYMLDNGNTGARFDRLAISNEVFMKMPIPKIDIAEQRAIASYFTTLDRQITLQTQRLEKLKQIKAASLQAMFPQEGETVPKLRFKGFDGEWERKRLNQFLIPSSTKNTDGKYNKKDVLSVSGEFGIVNQITFQGRSFAGVSVANYGVVEHDNIVYTKSPLKTNPYGIIKVNKGKAGIVSTLYAVYNCLEGTYPCFVEYYFGLDNRLNSYLRPLVRKGAKNDMKISSNDALLGEVVFPSFAEQRAIASYFTNLDRQITLQSRRLEKLKQIKAACLDKMFV